MADQIDFNLIRVADGDNDPEALATAYFYEEGTSTPLTVYSDQALTTPHGTSLASDANGIFAPVYTDGTVGVKVDVKDGTGATISGYPLDPARGISLTATGAAAISVTPFTGVASTNVQDALEEIYGEIPADLSNFIQITETTGSSNSYVLTSPVPITAYALGQRFLFSPNHTNTGAATIQIDGLASRNIRKYNFTGNPRDLDAGDLVIGRRYEMVYDGTRFILISDTLGDDTVPGVVYFLDEDDFASDSATAAPSQQSAKAYIDGAVGLTLATAQASTSGTAIDFTGIPAGVKEIVIMFAGVSLSGTDNYRIQLGDSGGFETTGYTSASEGGGGTANSTAGFVILSNSASLTMNGSMVLNLLDAATFQWVGQHGVARGTISINGGGAKALSAELTQIRITTSGSNTFDAGTINIAYR